MLGYSEKIQRDENGNRRIAVAIRKFKRLLDRENGLEERPCRTPKPGGH
jgi:hypothetical protein